MYSNGNVAAVKPWIEAESNGTGSSVVHMNFRILPSAPTLGGASIEGEWVQRNRPQSDNLQSTVHHRRASEAYPIGDAYCRANSFGTSDRDHRQ